MEKIKDLTDRKFGRWTVKYNTGRIQKGNGEYFWRCICDCGNEKDVRYGHLLSGATLSCGCYKIEKMKSKVKDLVGQRFGRLTVNYDTEKRSHGKIGNVIWHCTCDCGNELNVLSNNLHTGDVKSCGCYQKEKASEDYLKELTGSRFGKLVVIKRVENYVQPSGQEKTMWLCKCDCGKEIKVRSNSLLHTQNAQKSCGCLLESFIVGKLKKYFSDNYNAKIEYRILRNPKTKQWLPYDIYIPKGKNKDINGIYIEVNGKQHYELNLLHKKMAKRNNTTPEQELKHLQRRDTLKKNFAQKSGSYIEVDLRKIKSVEQAIEYINIEEFL